MKRPPFRVWIGIMVFFTTFQNYMLRSNMSVSIVGMMDQKAQNHTPPCRENDTIVKEKSNSTDGKEKFKWNEKEVGHVMAAYFWGYVVTSIPGGLLSEWIGPFHVIMWSSLVSAIMTGLTPMSAIYGGYIGVVVNRIIIGLLGGVVYPSLNNLISKWAPPNEKGRFMAGMMGNTLGTVVTFNLVGVVTSYMGWDWGFYILVVVLIVYCVAFFFIVSDNPDKSRWTKQEERDYIQASQVGHLSKKKAVPPYLKILTSIPFWACVIGQFGNLWGLNLIMTYAPKYMSDILGFDIKASAGLAALPYLARLFLSACFGTVGDWMRKKEFMSLTRLRKFFIIFSHFIPALCLLLIRAAGCNHVGVVSLLVLGQGINGAVVVGHFIIPQDISPNFAGSCLGIMNFVGMTTGFIVPQITGAVLSSYGNNLNAAVIIYMIGGIIFVICGILFIILASAEVQSWNEIKDKPEQPQQSQQAQPA